MAIQQWLVLSLCERKMNKCGNSSHHTSQCCKYLLRIGKGWTFIKTLNHCGLAIPNSRCFYFTVYQVSRTKKSTNNFEEFWHFANGGPNLHLVHRNSWMELRGPLDIKDEHYWTERSSLTTNHTSLGSFSIFRTKNRKLTCNKQHNLLKQWLLK